jgi:hypothetical protein
MTTYLLFLNASKLWADNRHQWVHRNKALA